MNEFSLKLKADGKPLFKTKGTKKKVFQELEEFKNIKGL
jgi:hypothetical protein